jgi:transcriptional regulator with XRE-family HTH domain
MRVGESTIARAVGRAIAKKRVECGMTQEEVAEKLEIGYEAVSRIERGTVSPSIDRLFELADIFSCSTAELITESSVRSRDQADQLAKLIRSLSESDRSLILDIVERLVVRLDKKGL